MSRQLTLEPVALQKMREHLNKCGISTCIISATKRGEPRTSWTIWNLSRLSTAHIQKAWDFAGRSPGLDCETTIDQFRPRDSCQPSKELRGSSCGDLPTVENRCHKAGRTLREGDPAKFPKNEGPGRNTAIQCYTMLYNAIQYHCTPSIIRVSNAARVPQDWIRNPPEIQYIKPYKTWAKHLDYSWTHSDLSKNGEQSQEPSRTYISLDWLVLCSV